MGAGKALQNPLRGGIDMAAVGAAAAGGVQMLCRETQKQTRRQQRFSHEILSQEKAGGEQDQSHSHTGKNGPALSLPTSGGILR